MAYGLNQTIKATDITFVTLKVVIDAYTVARLYDQNETNKAIEDVSVGRMARMG